MGRTDFAAVQRALEDIDFPAAKEDVVRHAERRGADEDTVRLLRGLPLGTYQNISDIRSSVPLDPAVDDGVDASTAAAQARSPRSQRIAEHLRDTD